MLILNGINILFKIETVHPTWDAIRRNEEQCPKHQEKNGIGCDLLGDLKTPVN